MGGLDCPELANANERGSEGRGSGMSRTIELPTREFSVLYSTDLSNYICHQSDPNDQNSKQPELIALVDRPLKQTAIQLFSILPALGQACLFTRQAETLAD